MVANFAGQIGVGSAREYFELVILSGADRLWGGLRFRSLLLCCHSTHGFSCDWRAGWRDIVRRLLWFHCARSGSCFHIVIALDFPYFGSPGHWFFGCFLAGRLGFEPRQSAPKALDLPLVDRPVRISDISRQTKNS